MAAAALPVATSVVPPALAILCATAVAATAMAAATAAFVIFISVIMPAAAFMMQLAGFSVATAITRFSRALLAGVIRRAAVSLFMPACNGYSFQLSVFKLGNGVSGCFCVGTIDTNSLIQQATQRVPVDACAKHGIDEHLLLGNVFTGIDIDVVVLAGFSIKDQQLVCQREMRLGACLQPCFFQDGNAEFHDSILGDVIAGNRDFLPCG